METVDGDWHRVRRCPDRVETKLGLFDQRRLLFHPRQCCLRLHDAVRPAAAHTPDTVLAFWQIIGAGLAGVVAILVTPSGWIPIQSGFDLSLLALLGIVAMTAHVLVNRALKLADAATVAPLQYTLLLWAVIFGWLIFGDVPQLSIVIGAGLIVLSGLYIFFRENAVKRKQAKTTVQPIEDLV